MITYIFMKLGKLVSYGVRENTMPEEIMKLCRDGELRGNFYLHRKISSLHKPVCPKALFLEFSDKWGSYISEEFRGEDFIIIEYDCDRFDQETYIVDVLRFHNVISYVVCKVTNYGYDCTLYRHNIKYLSTFEKSFKISKEDTINGIPVEDYKECISPTMIDDSYFIDDALYVVNKNTGDIITQILKDANVNPWEFPFHTINEVIGNLNLSKLLRAYSDRSKIQQDLF